MKKIITLLTLAFCLNTNAQIITTVSGNGTAGYSGDGGQATVAQINKPRTITFDAMGNMYIADYGNNLVRRVNTSGIITTIVGGGTSGLGDGGQATAATLNGPKGLIFDALGNLYIADAYNMRIRKVNTSGIITTIAGNGIAGYSGDGGQATDAELNYPERVVFDATGNFYIADYYNNRIRKVTTAGIITTIAGTGASGFSGDGGQATAAELNQPVEVIKDTHDNLYIADFLNNRVRKISTAGIITTIAGTGTAGYSGDGGQATSAELNNPYSVSFDCNGNLYIADYGNNYVRIVNTAGIITTMAGTGMAGYSGDGGLATAAELNALTGIAFNAKGNLFIADYNNSRIRRISMQACGQRENIENILENNNQINIYPNPTNGNFVIETTGKQTIQVFDITGKLVLSQNINGKTNIDARNLNEGVYTLNISGSEGVLNKKLVIVK